MDKQNEQEIPQEEEGNDILNDDYLLQLHKYLQQMKEERIKAEKDTKFLDNRVNCLKNEHEKTLKKIEVNRRKTQICEQARIRVNEARLQKGQFKEMKEKQLLEKKKQNQNMKQNNLQAILLKKEENSRKMEEDVKNFKEERKNNQELRKYLETEDLSNKKTQADYIKDQQRLAGEKRRALELEKKNKIKEELMKRILDEEKRIENAVVKRKKLEEEELEVMQELKVTTQKHEAMVENYEKLNIGGDKKE